jgi:DNA adenine methylase
MPLPLQSLTRSLLRYPGSKARLARFIASLLTANRIEKPFFIEPFCGSSAVSIALLEADLVSEIALNDIDPLIASLWKCVFSADADWLADKVSSVPLTLTHWEYQKRLQPKSTREAALKCLYLNRTSFSGILTDAAGPIGGRKQAKWKVGCRFNREKLVARILELNQFKDCVRVVANESWRKFCARYVHSRNVVAYFDPPFYHKASRLYRHVFAPADHKVLRNYVEQTGLRWILSYDDAAAVRALFSRVDVNVCIIDSAYSAHPIGGNSHIGRELFYTNLKKIPAFAEEETSKRTGLVVSDWIPNAIPVNGPVRIARDVTSDA